MCSPGDELIPFLTQVGCDDGVIAHCRVVRDVAVRIANGIEKAGTQVDIDLVAAGAIIHDIGRSQTHGMDHADVGGCICRSLGFDEQICLIVERHIGAGLRAAEREGFGLLPVDRIPETLEEKIVAHADNLVKGTRVLNQQEFESALDRFDRQVKERFLVLAHELNQLLEKTDS